jgi:glycosyltransferase involved in cell wall biosynthesis
VRYLIVITAPGRRLSPGTFATESAFADHLHAMKATLGPRFSEMVVAMPFLTEEQYQQRRWQLSVLDEVKEGIRFESLFPVDPPASLFLRQLPEITAKLARLVREADVVHLHPDYEFWRPVMAITSLLAMSMRKKLIAITDMDNRLDAAMNYKLGRWSTKSYLICRFVYDPIRDVQQRVYVKMADLMLYKEPQQVEDYGRGAAHVRLFLDPNFHLPHIISEELIAAKIRELTDPAGPLRLLYFGRLVPYKGIDKMIVAVAIARQRGAHLTFDIMGAGEDEARLRGLVEQHGLGDIVGWIEPKPYGESFFAELRRRHLLLACPLGGDTPRSTWDAIASGMPVLAFDTPFYRGMGKYTGAVDVVPWPDVEQLAGRLVEIAAHKERLAPQVRRAVVAARDNTGDDWLRRRVAWVEELFDKPAR